MKHKTLTITYYHSNIINEMLFYSEEDADEFDNALNDFLNNKNAIKEFKSAGNYPSLVAMKSAIINNTFQHTLGNESERLILACENMVSGYNGADENDCYKLPLLYIFNKIYNK